MRHNLTPPSNEVRDDFRENQEAREPEVSASDISEEKTASIRRIAKRANTGKGDIDDDEKKRRRLANASRMAFLRNQESAQEHKARNVANAFRMALLRNQESAEEHKARNVGNAFRMASLRSQEMAEEHAVRIADSASRMASLRSQEGTEEHAARIADSASRMASLRSQESAEEHAARIADSASRMASLRSQESAEEHAARIADSASRMASLRSQESAEEHDKRLNRQNNLRTARRANETISERETRLQQQQVYNQNYKEKRRQFEISIFNYADNICSVCKKRCYKIQTTSVDTQLPIVANVLPEELKREAFRIVMCNRCANTVRRGRTPTQAYWNSMFLDSIPHEIACLSDMEKRLLSRVIPFIKIIKLGGRFGQYGFHGQAVLFGQDLEEVAEQLPLRMSSAGIVIVCEQLESVQRQRQFSVDIQRLWTALNWLKENNQLYRNVQIDYSNVHFNIADVCQITPGTIVQNERSDIVAPTTSRRSCFVDIGNGREILRGSFHQGHSKFRNLSRGKQCTAAAAVSIATSKMTNITSWDTGIIDNILIVADNLYMESINARNAPDINEQNTEYLRPQELKTQFEAFSHLCTIDIEMEEETISGHLTIDNSGDGFPNLQNGIRQFFEKFESGILTSNGISIAIFKKRQFVFCF